MRAVVDTNILVDYLSGIDQARDELALYDEPAISIVTWMEVMVGANGASEEVLVREFLSGYDVLTIHGNIAEKAVERRRSNRIRLPDAIIWATAEVNGWLLVTRNTRDFPADHPGIRVPYSI